MVCGKPTENDIEPFVKIKIHGHPADKTLWCSKTSFYDVANPAWNEVVEFDIKSPENAIIEFNVSKLLHVDELNYLKAYF